MSEFLRSLDWVHWHLIGLAAWLVFMWARRDHRACEEFGMTTFGRVACRISVNMALYLAFVAATLQLEFWRYMAALAVFVIVDLRSFHLGQKALTSNDDWFRA